MKRCFMFLAYVICCASIATTTLAHSGFTGAEKTRTVTTTPDSSINIPGVKKIRVLLEEHSADKETKFLIKSSNGFVLTSPVDSENSAFCHEGELRLLCKKQRLYMCCADGRYHRIKYQSIEIGDPDNKLTFNGHTYQGNIIIRFDETKQTTLVINKLPLEDYVYGVVHWESIPSWPLGMQKVQAVISRTYAVFLMQQARLRNPRFKYFDIKNTNLHQVYNGWHNYKSLRRAIDETQNLILTYKGNIALTMFDICCGGSIPGKMRNRDVSKPYLCRDQRCTYCKKSPSYQWKEDLHVANFIKGLKNAPQLKQRFKKMSSSLSSIKIIDTDNSGIVQWIKLVDSKKKTFKLSGVELRSTFINRVKSLSFGVKLVRDRVVINGHGHGHQQGMCQWGAKQLIDSGWSVKSILGYYYPGTRLSRLL